MTVENSNTRGCEHGTPSPTFCQTCWDEAPPIVHRPTLQEALATWRATSAALRLRILSTTGGATDDERRIIDAAPKPSMEEYLKAQEAAAALLRAVVGT